ncbi:MAG: antitoxin Xre-like helix-turn-helix domain-containing protein [Desulfobacteraceae bacterium]
MRTYPVEKFNSSDGRGWYELKSDIDNGLPVDVLEELKETYRFTDESLAKILGVSTKTILRRKDGHLNTEESTRIYLLAKVLNKTRELMRTPDNVLEWIQIKNPALKMHTPLEVCTNIVGYEKVINLLNKIEWGIPY